MSLALNFLASSAGSVQGIDLKEVLILVFVLGIIGCLAWFVSTKPIPAPFLWCIYFVLGIFAIVIVWRFLQGL